MEFLQRLLPVLLILFLPLSSAAQNEDPGIISIYEGSRVIYDDGIGFEEFPVVVGDEAVRVIDGILRRQWCRAPDERSPLEIIRNYEQAISERGGEILFITREPQSVEIDEEKLPEYFKAHRRDRGLATNVFSYTHFPAEMSEFLTARITAPDAEYYLTIASGRGHWAASQNNVTYFEIVTLEVESMELGKVTMDALRDGIAAYGKAPVYNINFETGSAVVRPESAEALEVISEFMKQNSAKRFLVVGHTDNVGGYDMNQELSYARANAVVGKLIDEYGVDRAQIMPVGVGPASPVLSNSTEEGKARNRRVEIVER